MKKRCGVMLVLLLSICLSACKNKGDAKPTTQELEVNEFKDVSEEELALIEKDFKQLELQVLTMINHRDLFSKHVKESNTVANLSA